MAIISAIQTQKRKGRYNIYLDGRYEFAVSEDILVKYCLHKGQELNEKQITAIKNDEQIAKAYNKALDYLSYQLRTEKEIITYLTKHQFNSFEIENTIQKLKSQNLINDLQYAKSYVRTMMRTSDKGPQIISQKLYQKGVTKNDITEALAQFSFSLQITHATKIAQKYAHQYRHDAFKNQLNKIKRTLLSKGFTYDIINEAMKKLNLKKDEINEYEQLRSLGNKLLSRYHHLPLNKCLQKVKISLYHKGFNFDDINHFITIIKNKNEKE